MQLLADLFERVGAWPLVIIVTLYVILNGRFVFIYPRRSTRRDSVRAPRADQSQRL